MDLKQFEKNLEAKFKDYNPASDTSKLWDNIEDSLPKEKKDRKFLFMLMLGIGLLISGLSFWWSQESTTSETPPSSEIIENLTPTDLPIKSENAAIEINTSSIPTSNPIVAQKKSIDKNHEVGSSMAQSKITSESTVVSKMDSQATPLGNLTNSFSDQVIKPSAGESRLINIYSPNSSTEVSSVNNIEKLTFNFPAISTLHIQALPIQRHELNIQNIVMPIELAKTLEKTKIPFSMNLYTSVMKSNPQFSSTPSTPLGLVEARQSAHHNLETYALGMNGKFQVKPFLSLGIGLQYTQQNFSSIHTTQTNFVINEEVVKGIINKPNNVVEYITENEEREYTQITQYQRYNAIQSLSIPIEIAYTKDWNKKQGFDLGIGYEQVIFSHISGFEIDDGLQEYNLSDDVQNRYKKNSYGYFNMRSSYYQSLGEKSKIFFGLNLRHGLNSVTTENSKINIKYNYYGINTGIQFSF